MPADDFGPPDDRSYWTAALDIEALTRDCHPGQRFAVAMRLLLARRAVPECALHEASTLEPVTVHDVLDGLETPQPETIEEMVDAFTRAARGLLVAEIRALERIAQDQRTTEHRARGAKRRRVARRARPDDAWAADAGEQIVREVERFLRRRGNGLA